MNFSIRKNDGKITFKIQIFIYFIYHLFQCREFWATERTKGLKIPSMLFHFRRLEFSLKMTTARPTSFSFLEVSVTVFFLLELKKLTYSHIAVDYLSMFQITFFSECVFLTLSLYLPRGRDSDGAVESSPSGVPSGKRHIDSHGHQLHC